MRALTATVRLLPGYRLTVASRRRIRAVPGAVFPGKSLALLKQMVPTAGTIGYLMNQSNPSAKSDFEVARIAATALGIGFHPLNAATAAELEEAFRTLANLHVNAVGVMPDGFFDSQRDKVIELSARYRIAGCYPWREYPHCERVLVAGADVNISRSKALFRKQQCLRQRLTIPRDTDAWPSRWMNLEW